MFTRILLITGLLFSFATAANAACYGEKEQKLAQSLLQKDSVANLIRSEKNAFVFIHIVTCEHPSTNRHQKQEDGEQMRCFWKRKEWSVVTSAADRKKLNRARVVSALDDLWEAGTHPVPYDHSIPAPQ